ncbi:MAG: peptidoglycan bridge formation glycyltransferase FemA/FemB family protein, partial [Bacteroidia bacterium]|nr:peptidoglycan bridge formation glycyltransferase FemA/FemB family protein [Bacteroidia bacterium]
EPAKNTREMRFNFNTINWNFKKAYYNILPSNTIYLDLTPDTDVILNRMRGKTRYNIGLSQRKGVNVVQLGLENLDTWYSLYQETARRNRILINDIKYFEAVLTSNADNTESPATVYLLAATYDKTPLAAMFLIITGHRGSYLYGASSSEHRNLMATYALQWEAIKISKAMGCTEYDMFGVSPGPDPSHPLYGLYKFKIGFGGDLYHGLGCWDYPLKPTEYSQFISSELNSQGFHLNN